MSAHTADNDAPKTGCCQTCDVAAEGIPVPCDPDGEPIHAPRVTPPSKDGA